nr:SET and MYND domain-containing protein 4-like isoform X1 [Leptinotarsa decemlineata]
MSYCPKITELTTKLLEECELNTKTHFEYLRNLKYGHEKVNYVYELLKMTPSFQNIFMNSRIVKSNTISNILRKKGNDFFSEGNYAMALECFTKSILNAENSSESLVLAYQDRAVLLFRKKYYFECKQDTERALQVDCSTRSQESLINLQKEATKYKSHNTYFSKPIPQLSNENSLCSSATDFIEIKKDELVGRYFVAAKDINVGEILIVEKSFAHTTFPESQYLHCHECLGICYNLMPCPKCTKALFCSEFCREESWKTHHRYECDMIPLYGQLTLNFVKMVIIAVNQLKEESKDDEKYQSDRFKEINELVTNEDKRECVNFFYPIIMSCIGYHDIMTNTNISKDANIADNDLKDLIYKCIMIDSINSFNIKKYSECGDTSQKVALGIFSFSSFFNHSCAPNCSFFFHGRYLVVRAMSNIRKGEECNISYYGFCPFSSTKVTERQHYLRDIFFFDCQCRACKENWPTFESLPLGISESEMRDISVIDRESDELQRIIKFLGKVQTYPCQAAVYIQKKLTVKYNCMGNKIINF